jgi:hypothetical protein
VSSYLAIYLNDHLAGAIVGVELVRRIGKSNADEEAFAGRLDALREEIEADRATLETVIDGLGVSTDRIKPIGAWIVEKVARLKPNGQLRGYSPLSRVLELEGLGMGIMGKKSLWESLRDGGEDVAVSGVEYGPLVARAADQRAVVDEMHRLAVARLT